MIPRAKRSWSNWWQREYAIASDVNLFSRFYLLNKLTELGVETAIGTTAEEVTDQGVAVVDISGNRKVIDADTVVLAVGFRSNNKLQEKLEGKVPALYSVGDCVRLGKITGAIHGGSRVARQI